MELLCKTTDGHSHHLYLVCSTILKFFPFEFDFSNTFPLLNGVKCNKLFILKITKLTYVDYVNTDELFNSRC